MGEVQSRKTTINETLEDRILDFNLKCIW